MMYSKFNYILITIICFCFSCQNRTNTEKGLVNKKEFINNNNMTESQNKLIQQLLNEEFGMYFYYPLHTETLSNIRESVDNKTLEILLKNEETPLLVRLIACEVLINDDLDIVFKIGKHHFADIYAKALEQNITEMLNSWGLLYEHDDWGPIGVNFVVMGDHSVKALIPLLDNNTKQGLYEGSEEATVGNAYEYRVKDFAAFYIGKMKNIPITFYQDFEKRDAEIERLKKLLD